MGVSSAIRQNGARETALASGEAADRVAETRRTEAKMSDSMEAATPIRVVAKDDLDGVLAALPDAARAWVKASGFKAALGKHVAIPAADGRVAEVLFGWGDAAARRRSRFEFGRLGAALPEGEYRLVGDLSAEERAEAALAWRLGQYKFTRYKAGTAPAARLAAPEGVDAARVVLIAEAAYLARDLINTPAADMGPSAIETAFRDLAARHGAEASYIVGEDLLERNFPMIHAVGRAAADAPRLLEMRWGAEDAATVTLVGKGVAFDTGGLDIKPPASMGLMKKDMGGAANVMALAHMIMGAKLPVRLRVLVPAVENAISGNAFRPGDVLTSRKGLTVEVNNTDAEGRLVLADALALADEEAPGLILDMATLTGAARVAVGPDLSPFYTDDEKLAADLAAAAARVRDPVWRMPFWDPYEAMIEPQIADLDNAPSGGMAGSITAALFLRRFVEKAGAYAHFDIYGWTPAAKPGRPKGGECQAARACFDMLAARIG
jgi:leucyl aminopeptidase